MKMILFSVAVKDLYSCDKHSCLLLVRAVLVELEPVCSQSTEDESGTEDEGGINARLVQTGGAPLKSLGKPEKQENKRKLLRSSKILIFSASLIPFSVPFVWGRQWDLTPVKPLFKPVLPKENPSDLSKSLCLLQVLTPFCCPFLVVQTTGPHSCEILRKPEKQ